MAAYIERSSLRVRDAMFLLAALAPFVALLAVIFVRLEDPVYVWDFRHYWSEFQRFGEMIATGAPWLAEARASVRSADYNPVAAILLAPVYLLAGGAREVYVGAVSVLYLLPAALIAALLATRSGRAGRWEFAIVALLAVLFVPFWRPTLRGMVDIVALVPLGCAALLILHRGSAPIAGRLIARALAIGVLLWFAFLLRRHFAYTIVALFGLYAIIEALHAVRESARLPSLVMRLGISALSVVAFVSPALLFQTDLVLRAATTDYASLYQAYQQPFEAQVWNAVYRLGPIVLLLAGAGVLLAVIERKMAVLASTAVALTTFLLFSRTQAMADHHFLPVAFFLFPAIALPLIVLVQRNSTLSRVLIGFILTLSACVLVSATVLANVSREMPPFVSRLVSEPVPPLRLERIESYRELLKRLDELTAPDKRIVVFASSVTASDELFRALQPSLSTRLLPTPHIGEIGLFDFAQLSAEFAVAVNPLPTHMAPGSQGHLILANERLLTGHGFGAAFESTGDAFELADGMIATILRRARPLLPEEIDEFYDALIERFPTWRDRPAFAASRFASKAIVEPGDVFGMFRSAGDAGFVAHPGASEPTRVRFEGDMTGAPTGVLVTVSQGGIGCEGANGIGVTLGGQDARGTRHELLPGEAAELLFPSSGTNLFIEVDNNGDPTCDTAYVNFTRFQ